jgi:hypothetical protein
MSGVLEAPFGHRCLLFDRDVLKKEHESIIKDIAVGVSLFVLLFCDN